MDLRAAAQAGVMDRPKHVVVALIGRIRRLETRARDLWQAHNRRTGFKALGCPTDS